MAQSGDVIDNPVQQHSVKFIETSAQSNGASLKLEYTIQPGGKALPWHIHLKQAEHFTVVSGQLGIRLDTFENITILNVGEEIHIEAKRPHQFYNASDTEPVTAIFEVTPAGEFETFLQTYYGLARDGKIRKSQVPVDLLQAAVLADIADTYPVWGTFSAYIIRVVLKIFGTFARLLGYKALPEQYK